MTFTLTSHSYANSPYTDFYSEQSKEGKAKALPGTELELFEVTASGAFLLCSLIYLILYAWIYELCESKINRIVVRYWKACNTNYWICSFLICLLCSFQDTAFHAAGALFIFAAGCVSLYASVEIEDYGCTAFQESSTVESKTVLSTSGEFFCHHFVEKVTAAVRVLR